MALIEVDALANLPTAHTYAVVINCGTPWHSALAIAACSTRSKLPILLIDCTPSLEGQAHFARLAGALDIGLFRLPWPLRPHGEALDRLVSGVPASRVLLVDSDLEIVGNTLVDDLVSTLDGSHDAYGAGFLHDAGWMDPPAHPLPRHTAFYMERMWIPLVLLDVEKIRPVIKAGISFLAHREFTELDGKRLARAASFRFRIPLLRNLKLPRTQVDAGEAGAAWYEYDTGSRVHLFLAENGVGFSSLSPDRWIEARHYHGATRFLLNGPIKRLAQRLGMVEREGDAKSGAVQQRLWERYPGVALALGLDVAGGA